MPRDMTPACREITEIQRGVITRNQALGSGIPLSVVDGLLRSGRWLTLQRGVYLAHTGEPSREAALWGAVLLAGDGAALSHQTAAELFQISAQPSSLIHVAIPHGRQMSPAAGIVIHRSSRLADAVHPALLPPRTRLEETVLDLAGQATVFEAAFGPVCTAIQRHLTGSSRRSALGRPAPRQRARRAWANRAAVRLDRHRPAALPDGRSNCLASPSAWLARLGPPVQPELPSWPGDPDSDRNGFSVSWVSCQRYLRRTYPETKCLPDPPGRRRPGAWDGSAMW